MGFPTDMTIHTDDQTWITENWLPRAIEAGLRAGASKRPAAYFAQRSVARILSAAPPGVALNVFNDINDAKAWLRIAV